jgi:hypothetical protein
MKIKLIVTLDFDVDGKAPLPEIHDAVILAISDAIPGVVEVNEDCVLLMNTTEAASVGRA